MAVSQFIPVTTLLRDHLSVLGKLINGPVVLASRSKPAAILLSVGDYEKLLADSESVKRYQRNQRADKDFADMMAGDYSELLPEVPA